MDIVERLRDRGSIPPTREEAAEEIERLREALQNVLDAQPIKGDEGSANIVDLAKALLKIDEIADAALKENP